MISIVMGIALTIAASATPTPSLYQQQHQQEEMANCLAKHGTNYPAHFCDTPTPAATATPVPAPSTPAPTPQSISTSTSDELVPTASETPEPVCWLTSDDPRIGDPASGGIVYDGDGNPIPCDAVTPNEDAPASGPLPDPPMSTPTPVVVIQRITVQAPAPPPQVIYREPTPQPTEAPEVVYVEVTPTATATPEPSHTPASRPSVTPTSAPTMTPTVTPTPTAEPTALVAASVTSDPPSTPDPMTPQSILEKVGLGGLALAILGIVLWAVTAKEHV